MPTGTHSGKKNAGGVVNQAHTLFPSWHPHEVRQSKSKRMDRNPGWIGGGAFTPVKKSIREERDSRVGEDKEEIKTRVSSKKRGSSINSRSSNNNSAIKRNCSCKYCFQYIFVNFVQCNFSLFYSKP